MLVVLPFFAGDLVQRFRTLQWSITLDKKCPLECLLSYESNADPSEILRLAQSYFTKVHSYAYDPWDGQKHWPIPQNIAFQAAARHIAERLKQPWFWWEPDLVPTKKGWLLAIADEYQRAKRPFMGVAIDLYGGYMAGCGVYPANVADYTPAMLIAHDNNPFDVAGGPDIFNEHLHNASHLIQHERIERYQIRTFAEANLKSQLLPSAVCFHPCKDLTLIDRLCESQRPTFVASIFKKRLPVIVHVVERHKEAHCQNNPRVARAFNSWTALYQAGLAKPCHVWDYPRDSAALGDPRGLPYLKDILSAGLGLAEDKDIIMLTNDDGVLHPNLPSALAKAMSKQPALSAFRLNFAPGKMPDIYQSPDSILRQGKGDLGRDLFAFRKSWLLKQWSNIPDFLLGEMEWDLILAMIIRRDCGIESNRENLKLPQHPCELARGLIWHESHKNTWQNTHYGNPAKSWNRKLASEWCAKYYSEYPIISE